MAPMTAPKPIIYARSIAVANDYLRLSRIPQSSVTVITNPDRLYHALRATTGARVYVVNEHSIPKTLHGILKNRGVFVQKVSY